MRVRPRRTRKQSGTALRGSLRKPRAGRCCKDAAHGIVLRCAAADFQPTVSDQGLVEVTGYIKLCGL
jgi:hypothetical protein